MRELVKGGWLIRLYPAIRSLSELKLRITTTAPSGRGKTQIFADNAERDRALKQRAAALIAEGWVDRIKPTSTKSEPSKNLEPAFAALVRQTIVALKKARTAAQDAAAWRRAIAAYGKLKVKAGGDPTENLVHFFAVDGIALERKHPVVFKAVDADAPRKARWTAALRTP